MVRIEWCADSKVSWFMLSLFLRPPEFAREVDMGFEWSRKGGGTRSENEHGILRTTFYGFL